MAPMTTTIEAVSPGIEHCNLLPANKNEWSTGAKTAYQDVLSELDMWSRRQDASKSLNSWIAEEAVRQTW